LEKYAVALSQIDRYQAGGRSFCYIDYFRVSKNGVNNLDMNSHKSQGSYNPKMYKWLFHSGVNLIKKVKTVTKIVRTGIENLYGMKRTCHGNKIYGGGTKGHVNIIREANSYGMEFHKYIPKFQYLTTIFTYENNDPACHGS
jgi:hypothetical protein